MNRLYALTVFVLTSALTQAFAAWPLEGKPGGIEQLDLDSDGKLSMIELAAGTIIREKEDTQVRSGHEFLGGLKGKAKEKGGNLAYKDLGVEGETAKLAREITVLNLLREKKIQGAGPFPMRKFDAKKDFRIFAEAEASPTKIEIQALRHINTRPTLMLRRNLDEMGATLDPSKIRAQTQGALLSFSQNNETSIDQWVTRGALILRGASTINHQYTGEEPARYWAKSGYLYSALDKIDTGGSDAMEVDSLSFGGGYDLTWLLNPGQLEVQGKTAAERIRNAEAGGGLSIDYFTLDTQIDYNTDTDFDHQILTAQADMIPVFTQLGINNYRSIPIAPFLMSWKLRGHLEGGEVFDTGGMSTLVKDGFGRAGGEGGIGLYFPNLNDLTLEAIYLHHETFSSSLESPSYFEGELQLPLDELFRFAAYLTVNYRKGTLENTLQEDDSITVGLSAAF